MDQPLVVVVLTRLPRQVDDDVTICTVEVSERLVGQLAVADRSFGPEFQWKTRMIRAIHEAVMGFGADSLVRAPPNAGR